MLEIYQGRKIFITGHSGFKGSWLTLWLNLLGAEAAGYSLPPDTSPALFNILALEDKCRSAFGDIAHYRKLLAAMRAQRPEIVFHLAAQPLVRRSYAAPVTTYRTNVLGTLNVLEAARACGSVRALVNVTTDKCYENLEVENAYTEDSPLGGHDLYSSSKACAEILSSSYRRSFLQGSGCALATARAGNVIGGGDWAQDRLVPDSMRAWSARSRLEIRYPEAVRPWQHVLEPLWGYLLLGAKLLQEGSAYAQAYNFAPQGERLSVREMVNTIAAACPGLEIVQSHEAGPHEAGLLVLNTEKARRMLNWRQKFSTDQTIRLTVDWYRRYYEKKPMLKYTLRQIEEHMRA